MEGFAGGNNIHQTAAPIETGQVNNIANNKQIKGSCGASRRVDGTACADLAEIHLKTGDGGSRRGFCGCHRQITRVLETRGL